MLNRKRKGVATAQEIREREGAGPPVIPDKTTLQGPKKKWTIENAATAVVPMLSVYKVQMNTQWKVRNAYEQAYVDKYLRETIEETFKVENLHNYINWGTTADWEGAHKNRLRDENQGGVISGMRIIYNTEYGGGPAAKDNIRAHAHGLLYISHRSNFWVSGIKLQSYMPHVWDQLAQDDPERPMHKQLFTNGPDRLWNVRVKFIRPNEETYAYFYANKNVRDLNQQIVRQRLDSAETLDEDFDSQKKKSKH